MLKRLFEQNASAVRSTHAQFLVFQLGDEEYGIDIDYVRELRGYHTATPVANSKEYIKGVINLRGVIVPVVDMRIKFNLARATYDQSTAVIVLNIVDRMMAVVVDSVSNMVSVAPEQIGHLSQACAIPMRDTLIGVSSLPNRLLHLVDINALYSSIDFGMIERLSVATSDDDRHMLARESKLCSRYLWAPRVARNHQVSALKFRPQWRPMPK